MWGAESLEISEEAEADQAAVYAEGLADNVAALGDGEEEDGLSDFVDAGGMWETSRRAFSYVTGFLGAEFFVASVSVGRRRCSYPWRIRKALEMEIGSAVGMPLRMRVADFADAVERLEFG